MQHFSMINDLQSTRQLNGFPGGVSGSAVIGCGSAVIDVCSETRNAERVDVLELAICR